MKKFYLLLALVCLGLFSFSQSFVNEDFSSGQMPPDNWTIDGFATQWEAADSKTAGGNAPEAKFTYVQSVGVSRLVSPTVDLSGETSVKLRFRQFYDNYSDADPKIGVATRSGGGDWNVAWELAPSGDLGPELRIIDITTADVGASDFQFCIYIDGNFYNMDYWYIDDVTLYIPYLLDAELSSLNTPNYVNEPTEVTGTISNFSLTTINSLEIKWQVGDGTVNTTSLTGLSIGTTESYGFSCDQLFDFPIGDYEIHAWIATVNGVADEDQGNN